ncbi:MAG: hypothetical protein JXQ65_11235 [Candidatus Marinimicrobia bacterium]|nr:hypothetical protein [Candidatus Neomarinimicrobiota bacterium]
MQKNNKDIVIILSDKSQSRGLFTALKTYADQVTVFNNPVTAMEYLKNNHCRIILTEKNFTLMDGNGFIQQLLQDQYADNLIILEEEQEVVQKPDDSARIIILNKPVDLNNLLAQINKIYKEEL